MATPLKTVKIPKLAYKLVYDDAKRTGRKLQFVLAQAIYQFYGVVKDGHGQR